MPQRMSNTVYLQWLKQLNVLLEYLVGFMHTHTFIVFL